MKRTTFMAALRKRKEDGSWPSWDDPPTYEEWKCYTVEGSGLAVHGISGSWDISHMRSGRAMDSPCLRNLPTLKVAEKRIRALMEITNWNRPHLKIAVDLTLEDRNRIEELLTQWRKEDRKD